MIFAAIMVSLDDKLAEVDELKSRLDALRPLPPDVEGKVMQKLRMLWNFHSNAIEGNQYSLGETQSVVMHGLTAKGKPIKDYLDIAGHNEAIDYLLALIRREEELTEAALRKLHEILLVKAYEVEAVTTEGKEVRKMIKLGEYKTEPNHVETSTGEIHYYASPEETPILMGELIKWYRTELQTGSLHPVALAATFHHRFTHIHPFDDGNGRLSRLLMNLIVMQRGYPPAIFQIAERDQYLSALQHADAGDITDLIHLLASAITLSLQIYLKASGGEQIHDLLDISRDVALLKQSLMHVKDPQELSPAVLRAMLSSAIVPLVQSLLAMLREILDLFRTYHFNVVVNWSLDLNNRRNVIEIDPATFSIAVFEPFMASNAIFKTLEFTFTLRGFKRAGTDSFDLARSMHFIFEPLRYRLITEGSDQTYLYESLDADATYAISGAIMRWFVHEIRSRAKLEL